MPAVSLPRFVFDNTSPEVKQRIRIDHMQSLLYGNRSASDT